MSCQTPAPQGYAPCTRDEGHPGPCAMPHAKPIELMDKYVSTNHIPMIRLTKRYSFKVLSNFYNGKHSEIYTMSVAPKGAIFHGGYDITYYPEECLLVFGTIASRLWSDESQPISFYMPPDKIEEYVTRFVSAMKFEVAPLYLGHV